MRIRWFGGAALLGAAGIVALLSTAAVADVVIRVNGTTGDLTGPEITSLAGVVNGCWTACGSGNIQQAVFYRDGEKVYQELQGACTLTRAQAIALLQAGKPLAPNRIQQEQVTCEITLPANLSALGSVASRFWPGNVSTLESMRVQKTGPGAYRVVHTQGLQTMTEDEAVDLSDAGQNVVPVATVEP